VTPEEFRKQGHAIVDWIADYRRDVAEHPVMAASAPGDVRRALPAVPPAGPEPFADIIRDLDRVIVPGITHWQHPAFFGYFPSVGVLSSVLGDFLSTGLGVIGLSWQAGPAVTELEEVVCDWLRQMLGLSETWSGVIHDTASSNAIVALICARERASHFALGRGGLQAEDRPLMVYASAHAHSSVDKAALMAGFGRDNVRIVPCDAHYAMCADELAALMESDVRAGKVPCAVVATVGTTTATAIDPVAAIAAVAARFDAWLHVDAAMAGSAMVLPECRWMWEGVEGADSIVVNAHKWLGAAFDCSLYYVRDPEHLVRVMSTNPSYLQSPADGTVKNFRDWGLPLGRRFRALKLWCLIREQGISGLQARLRRDLENAKWLESQVRAAPDWRVLAAVTLQTVCVRHEPAGVTGGALDAHTQRWAARLNESGAAYVTPAILAGRWMVRVSIGAEQTERGHVEELWRGMRMAVG
jgi:aromatic-L-amino-acid decarboxylase